MYRRAAERPRSFVVVLGIWLIFGSILLVGISFVTQTTGRAGERLGLVGGVATILLSLAVIGRTTAN